MSIEQTFISAIRSKTSLEVTWKDSSRIVCPYRIGWKTTTKKGQHENVLVYQIGGHSERGLEPRGSTRNFRCWNLDDINSAHPVDAAWYVPSVFSQKHSECVDEVIAEARF